MKYTKFLKIYFHVFRNFCVFRILFLLFSLWDKYSAEVLQKFLKGELIFHIKWIFIIFKNNLC